MLGSFSQPSFHASFTSLTLLDRAKHQDEQAWETIICLYAPLVYRWCKRSGMSYHDIENLSQDVFTLAFRKLDQFRKKSAGDSFRGWLFTLVRNRRIDWLRKKNKQADALGGSNILRLQQQLPDPIETEELEDLDAADQEELFLFNRAIQLIREEFSPRDQTVIEALLCRDEDPAHLAERLNLSRNTIYIIKSRALRRLREEFAGLVDSSAELIRSKN